MVEAETVNVEDELLTFFKALADVTRLRIAGRLAEGACSPEALAAWLGQRPAVVRHHLEVLVAAGLAQPQGAGYCLRLEGVRALAGRRLAHAVTQVPEGAAADAYEHKVLREFLTPEGALRELPVQERKLRVVLRYAAQSFEPGERYTEKEVNTRLLRLYPDNASLRRALVDFGLLQRQPAGQAYWRAEPTAAA